MELKNLHQDLQKATGALLKMARDYCWNSISDHCLYILSEIENGKYRDFLEERIARVKENKRKTPVTLLEMIPRLARIFDNLYDVNLYIYEAGLHTTIIDIRYYPKSALHPEHRAKVAHNPPMLHCKLPNPPCQTEPPGLFDVNWEINDPQGKRQ